MLIFHLLISLISAAPVYSNGMNPGMALRLEQRTVDAWKATMADFLPHYINADLQLPKEKELVISGLFDLIHYDIKWTNISYDVATIDVKDIQFYFQAASALQPAQLTVDFPALKEWKIHAQQSIANSWAFPDNQKVYLEFKDFDLKFGCDFALTVDGYLKPIVYTAEINFGDSYFYHENKWFAAAMMQFIEFAIIMVENAVYFGGRVVGEAVFTNLAEPVLTSFLNGYRLPLPRMPSPFHGQDTYADFVLDWRNVENP